MPSEDARTGFSPHRRSRPRHCRRASNSLPPPLPSAPRTLRHPWPNPPASPKHVLFPHQSGARPARGRQSAPGGAPQIFPSQDWGSWNSRPWRTGAKSSPWPARRPKMGPQAGRLAGGSGGDGTLNQVAQGLAGTPLPPGTWCPPARATAMPARASVGCPWTRGAPAWSSPSAGPGPWTFGALDRDRGYANMPWAWATTPGSRCGPTAFALDEPHQRLSALPGGGLSSACPVCARSTCG